MDVFEILNDKSIRKLEARKLIADSISDGSFSLTDFSGRAEQLKDKQTATFLEAIESVTGQKDSRLGVEYLEFARSTFSRITTPASAKPRASSATWRIFIPMSSA